MSSKVDDGSGMLEDAPRRDVQVLIQSGETPLPIRKLNADHISELVMVPGIVIAASKVKAKALSITAVCTNCKNIKIIPCKPGFGGAVMPRRCDTQIQLGETPCPLDPFLLVPDKSKYVDQQVPSLAR